MTDANPTVLLVEDDLQVAEVVDAMLSELGHRVRRAEHADAALAILKLEHQQAHVRRSHAHLLTYRHEPYAFFLSRATRLRYHLQRDHPPPVAFRAPRRDRSLSDAAHASPPGQ